MTYRGPDAKDQWPYICSRSACGRRLPRPLTDLCIDCLPGAHDDNCQDCHGEDGEYADRNERWRIACRNPWHDETETTCDAVDPLGLRPCILPHDHDGAHLTADDAARIRATVTT